MCASSGDKQTFPLVEHQWTAGHAEVQLHMLPFHNPKHKAMEAIHGNDIKNKGRANEVKPY